MSSYAGDMIQDKADSKQPLLEDDQSGCCDDKSEDFAPKGRRGSKAIPSLKNHIVLISLLLSLGTNLILGFTLYHLKATGASAKIDTVSQQISQREKTNYAGLQYDVNSTWHAESRYASEDIDASDREWMAIDIRNAFVALDKDHAKDLGLPQSLPFPWDREHKDLYLISSIHSMHCLTVLHRSNLEYRTNHTQTYSTEHILHCLDNIRVDIQCSADDTPRFVPPYATESTVKTGVGQNRQCRDWSKLNTWAEENTACFRYNEFLRHELEGNKVYPWAFQFCGKDSEYLSTVQKFLQKGPEWISPEPAWPDIDEIQKNS